MKLRRNKRDYSKRIIDAAYHFGHLSSHLILTITETRILSHLIIRDHAIKLGNNIKLRINRSKDELNNKYKDHTACELAQ